MQVGPHNPQASFALPAQLIEALLPISTYVAVAKGESIFRQGEPCRGIFIIRSGQARISMRTGDAVEVYSRILDRDCVLGLPASLCGEAYSTSAVALGVCDLARIEASRLQEFIRTRPDLSIAIVQAMSKELSDMNIRRANIKSCKSCGCPPADTCSHHLYNPT